LNDREERKNRYLIKLNEEYMNRMKIRSGISIILTILVIITLSMPSFGQASQSSRKVDKSAILLQFQNQLFEPLNLKLEEFQKAFEGDYQLEDCVFDAFEAFKRTDPNIEPILQNWAAKFPNSYAPYIARAEYYCASALKARGNKRIIEKDQNEYKEMEQYYSLALMDIDQALKLNAKLDICYAMKIEIGTALGNKELITNALAEASKHHPYGYRVKLKYVQTLTPRKGGSYEKMEGFIRSYEKMAVDNPKMKELYASIPAEKGSTSLFLGKYDQAVIMYTDALKYSKNHSYYADRGDAYARMQKYKLALADYDKALELSPKDPEYIQRKAQMVSTQNRSSRISSTQETNQQSDKYDDWPPKALSASEANKANEHAHKGFEFLSSRQFDKAIIEYNEAIQLRPDVDNWYYNRGLGYMYSNNGDAAIQDFNRAIQLKPENILAYTKIMTIYADRGMYDDAINTISRVIAIEPDNAEAYYSRGKVFEKKGMNVEAVEDIRKSCEMGFDRACREYKINK
jgi:tetratricopeptide (TPR) repeat protein